MIPRNNEAALVLGSRDWARRARAPFVQYAALGIAGGAAFAASLVVAPGSPGFFGGGLALLMLAIALADARALVIPNELTLAAFLLGLTNAAAEGMALDGFALGEGAVAIGMAVLRAITFAAALLCVREAYRRLRGRQGIGLGDVKLAGVAGAWLDWTLLPVALEIAALTALAAYGIGALVSRRRLSATAKLPFGLFFAPAIWLGWLFQALVFTV